MLLVLVLLLALVVLVVVAVGQGAALRKQSLRQSPHDGVLTAGAGTGW